MPKSASRSRTAKVRASSVQDEITPTDIGVPTGVSPILYQAVIVPRSSQRIMAREGASGAGADKAGKSETEIAYVSGVSRSLPEPTSYAGKNLIALNFDSDLFSERPNQSRVLEFDGSSTHVDCGNPPHLQGGGASSLTIEAWIKASERGGEYRHIVSHGQAIDSKHTAEVFLRMSNGRFEFGTWNGKSVFGVCNDDTRVRNEDMKNWVHLAGVYDHVAKTYRLYRNGTLIASADSTTAPLAVDRPWYIGAMWEEAGKKMLRYFSGYIAEVRIWTVARTEAEIRRHMLDSAPPTAPGQLGVYWRLGEGDGTTAEDSSGNECAGTIRGKINWNWATSPVGDLSRLLRRQPVKEVEAAFKRAKDTGFFDTLVFPRIRAVMTPLERKRAKEAIRDLDLETFKAFYDTGQHMMLRRALSGETEYVFIANPPATVKPQLMLVEEYRLSSFLGKYGVGRTLKSFSLLPGERTKLTIKTASSSTTTAKQSQSILDSFSQESANEFESSLAAESSNKSTSSEDVSYSASVEASGSWGFGSAKASASAGGSTNSAREEFAKTVSNATSKHTARASANRNVQIESTTETKITSDLQTETIREIENINVGRTLNFVFCQMNQEFITLLHLIDVRIGYTNGIEAVREVPLYQLPELLERVTVNDSKKRQEVQERIIEELKSIRDYKGKMPHEYDPPKEFIVAVKGETKPARYAVNRDFASAFGDPASTTRATVPGIIISAKNIVMRTEDIAVDALIGSGSALDGYAENLQIEENRQKRLANDAVQIANEAAQIKNQLMELEAKRNALFLDLVEKKEITLLNACMEAMRATPPGTPSRIVGVWDQDALHSPAVPARPVAKT